MGQTGVKIEDKVLLTTQEVAKLFNVSPRRIIRWSGQNGFPEKFKIFYCSNTHFFRCEEVLDWIENNNVRKYEKHINLSEVADKYSVSINLVKRRINDGKLRPSWLTPLGRPVFYLSDLKKQKAAFRHLRLGRVTSNCKGLIK